MRVLFATAELAPLARVGGLAEAAAGLALELQRQGIELTIVLPDYGDIELDGADTWALDGPEWAGELTARRGSVGAFGDIILVGRPGMARPHPYVDPVTGQGWPDNDYRFYGFAAGIAALVRQLGPDLLHLNDWHTAATLGFLGTPPPTMLTIHTLGYQGISGAEWLGRLPVDPWRFAWYDVTNPLLGAIRSADAVVAVSPNYAREILTPEQGMGLDHELARIGDTLVGIRNGIDTGVWNPATDPHLPVTYRPGDDDIKTIEAAKNAARSSIAATFGVPDDDQVLIAMVTRLVDQKGVDIALGLAPYLEHLGARLVILGSGQANLVEAVRSSVDHHPHRIAAITDRYDEPLAHQMFAGADLFVMPSRFEPCGLAQMQAMAYGTIPVATAVGGLVDTITDADDDPTNGTGFLSATVDLTGLVDANHRAVRAHRAAKRRRAIQKRGMAVDWSWHEPAKQHIEWYQRLLER
ncbi:MAG: glycogen/starch synthase [Acidimicrobiales bacterium]